MSILTSDQKNILRAINDQSQNRLAAQMATASLTDEQAIAKINAWLPTGQMQFTRSAQAIQNQIGQFQSMLATVNGILTSINVVKAANTPTPPVNPPA